MRTPQKLRRQDGAAAVEFALIAGLLFMILFGIMEFGLAFFETQNLRSATREGARAAAIGGTTGANGEITKALVDGASGSLPDNYTGYTLDPPDGCEGDAAKGEEVEIVLNINQLPPSVRAAFQVNIPFVPEIELTPEIKGSFRCE
jgi:hypothetical protein